MCGFAFELGILHTNSEMPSVSLIKSICFPKSYRVSVEATKWGCQHEELALDAPRVIRKTAFKFSYGGLCFFYFDRFIVASTDSLISCDCCGEGCLEVKCPYCKRNGTVDEASNNDPKFCIQSGCLSTTHPYYAQIQTQMSVCNRKHCG